jgi:thioredoxin 1
METVMNKGVITIIDAEFETEVLTADLPVLVYFWAEWCGPCKLMSPLMNLAADKYSDRLKIVKMEVDPNPKTVKQYEVEGVPGLRLIKNKEVILSLEGVMGKEKLFNCLDEYLAQK